MIQQSLPRISAPARRCGLEPCRAPSHGHSAQAAAGQYADFRQPSRDARKGPRHLAVLFLASMLRPRAGVCPWPGRSRVQAWRQALRDRRQPSPSLLGAAGRAGARRHGRAALPRLDCQRTGLLLQHAEVVMIVAEDQEQIDKILSIAGELPGLRLLFYEDSRGMSAYAHPLLKSFTDLEAMGRAFNAIQPGYFERELNEGRGSDVALIAYTSGTTGRSKGALLSHVNMIATSESFASVESIERGDSWLCYLPMGWVGDSMFSLSTSLVVAATCNCPE